MDWVRKWDLDQFADGFAMPSWRGSQAGDAKGKKKIKLKKKSAKTLNKQGYSTERLLCASTKWKKALFWEQREITKRFKAEKWQDLGSSNDHESYYEGMIWEEQEVAPAELHI